MMETLRRNDAIAALRCTAMSVRYGERVVFQELDWALGEGIHQVVLGANGAGKSSFLDCLVGYLPVGAGEVRLYGQPLGELDSAQIRRHISYQPAVSSFQNNVTVRELMEVYEVGFGLPRGLSDLRTQIDRGCGKTRFKNLSAGERKLLTVYLSLTNSAPVVLLDEPTAGLDVYFKKIIREAIAGDERTILVTTHDLDFAIAAAQEMYVICGGGIFRLPLVNARESIEVAEINRDEFEELAPVEAQYIVRDFERVFLFAPDQNGRSGRLESKTAQWPFEYALQRIVGRD